MGTVAYSSSGLELRVPESVRNIVSLPLGLVSPGMYGALIKVRSEAIGAGCRLLLRLTAQAERLRIQGGVAAGPEDGAVRLAGIEAAKIAAPSAAKSSAATAAETASAETARTAKASRPPNHRPPPPNRPALPPAKFPSGRRSARARFQSRRAGDPYPRRPAGSPRPPAR